MPRGCQSSIALTPHAHSLFLAPSSRCIRGVGQKIKLGMGKGTKRRTPGGARRRLAQHFGFLDDNDENGGGWVQQASAGFLSNPLCFFSVVAFLILLTPRRRWLQHGTVSHGHEFEILERVQLTFALRDIALSWDLPGWQSVESHAGTLHAHLAANAAARGVLVFGPMWR